MIFLDIETAAMAENFAALSPRWASLWESRHDSREFDGSPAESFEKHAALCAEFSRVVSVAIATIHGGSVTGFVSTGDDEVALLKIVAEKLATRKTTGICAHCGIGFDFPFLARRFMANSMAKEMPFQLQTEGKKPWEMLWHDTNQIWSCGKMGGSVTLDLLCEVLGVPSPKTGVDGASVHKLFYGKRWEDLRRYNAADVTALARCYAILVGSPSPSKTNWNGSFSRIGGESLASQAGSASESRDPGAGGVQDNSPQDSESQGHGPEEPTL